MTCRPPRWVRAGSLGLVALVLTAIGAPLSAASLKDFFGTYVGHATVEDADGETSYRDMDIVIEPFHDDGFQIHWITVIKVDGRRDVPGVRRILQSAFFEPADGRNLFIEVGDDNPFQEREQMQPMSGHAVRWAKLDGDQLHVYSFVVLDDGTYEFQIYDRVLTEAGLDIVFQRFDDGQLVREIDGSTVRALP